MNKLKKSFSFGGGETIELTCLEAADRFVKNVLSKKLESENVRFPEHRIRLGTKPEGPKLPKQRLEERGNQITEPGEKKLFNHYLSDVKGKECEKAVWDYIIRTPSDVRCATFMSYDNKMFLQFTGASDTTETEAPDVQNPDAEKTEAHYAEKDEAPDAEKAEAPDAKKAEAEKAQASDTEKVEAPDPEKVEAPYTEKAKAPDAEKAKASDAEKTQASEPEKAEASDAEKAPDTEKAKAPDAEKAKAPYAEKAEAPYAEKAKAPDDEKSKAPNAEKAEDSDVSTTSNKSTQTQDEDLKKVPKIKAKKSANTQAQRANKSSKAMANKCTKDEDYGDNKCPDGRSHKATQTKSARGKANKGPPTDNQEFDFVFLLGEYKTFVVFEVKASFNHAKGKWEDQLKRAELFYKTIIKYIGDEDYKDWTFLPVAAFPNAPNIKQVIFFSIITKKIIYTISI